MAKVSDEHMARTKKMLELGQQGLKEANAEDEADRKIGKKAADKHRGKIDQGHDPAKYENLLGDD